MQTRLSIKASDLGKEQEKLKEEASRNGFNYGLMPTEVNACYLPYLNSINVPAAILDGVAYDENADEMENLGRIGFVLAHEISHAFDAQGILYDAYGNYDPESMPISDMEAFEEIKKKCAGHYDKYTVLSVHVNGIFTLSENLADLGAMQCCLAIAATPENQKIMLESFAKLWSSIVLDTEAKSLLKTDNHSPDDVRVNAVVSCFDEFYGIYDVKEGDPMYVASDDRIRRW
jgi:predicted metalloendopeptidase